MIRILYYSHFNAHLFNEIDLSCLLFLYFSNIYFICSDSSVVFFVVCHLHLFNID